MLHSSLKGIGCSLYIQNDFAEVKILKLVDIRTLGTQREIIRTSGATSFPRIPGMRAIGNNGTISAFSRFGSLPLSLREGDLTQRHINLIGV